MKYAKVNGQEVGKIFSSKEEAILYNNMEENNIFPVFYPMEWLGVEDKKRENGQTLVKIGDEYEKCFVMGIDVSYPQE